MALRLPTAVGRQGPLPGLRAYRRSWHLLQALVTWAPAACVSRAQPGIGGEGRGRTDPPWGLGMMQLGGVARWPTGIPKRHRTGEVDLSVSGDPSRPNPNGVFDAFGTLFRAS